MGAERLIDIFSVIARHEALSPGEFSLCAVATEVTELTGAGIALLSPDNALTRLCTSNHVALELMNLELTTGEGPLVDASRGTVTEEPDLRFSRNTQWLTYAPEALAIGAQAVFAFPIRLGAANFGALGLFRDSPGPLSPAQWSDGYLMASVIARSVLATQSGTPPGLLADELEGQASLDFVVHQAAGMLAVQGSISIKSALVALRARAFATSTSLVSLADQVVNRKISFHSTSTWSDLPGSESP